MTLDSILYSIDIESSLSIYLSIYLSICLYLISIYLPTYLSFYLSNYLSIYLLNCFLLKLFMYTWTQTSTKATLPKVVFSTCGRATSDNLD